MAVRSIAPHHIKFVIYLLVIVLANLAGLTLFFRVDLTANQIYSISKASHEVVATLSEPLTIKVFFTQNLPAPHNSTERYLRDLLEEYAAQSNRYFNYRFYDVSADQGDMGTESQSNREMAESYGIYPVQIQAVEQDEVKFQKAYMGLVIIHGDLIERIGTISSINGLEYDLTSAIQKLNNKISALLRLQEKVKITLYLSKSLEAVAPFMQMQALNTLPRKIEKIVADLNDKAYGKLAYSYVPAEQNLEQLSKKYNLLALKWLALENGRIPAGQGVIGLVLSHGAKHKTIPLVQVINIPIIGTQYELADPARLDQAINGGIETLIDINEDIGFLADHGTPTIQGRPRPGQPPESLALNGFRRLISQNYSLKSVNLEEGIPDSINCLVIARPTAEFSDYDLFQIDQFLMQGKSLALFLSTFNEVMPGRQQQMMGGGPQYVPINTGLERLLSHYGVGLESAYVMDELSFKQRLPAEYGGGEQNIYFAPLIQNQNINTKLDFMKNIKGLIAFKASPLSLDQEQLKKHSLTAHRLIASSEKSWEMRDRINLNPMFMQPPKEKADRASFPLAYLVEGEFPSYFAGKPLPAKPQKEAQGEGGEDSTGGEEKTAAADAAADEKKPDLGQIQRDGQMLAKGKAGRIFVLGSADMLGDNVLDAEGRSPNSIFIMNSLDYLNNRSDIAVMRSKEQQFNPLNATAAVVKTAIKSFNIIGLPILVIIFGLLMWAVRRSHKRRIQMIFTQAG